MSAVPQVNPAFPTEVIERVIDLARQLQYDAKAVNFRDVYAIWRACALTCRAMVPRSQYWLFRFISLEKKSQAENLAEVLRHNMRIGKYTQSLSLQWKSSTSEEKPGAPSPWISWVPQLLASHMTNLHALYLSCDTTSSCHPSFLMGLTAFKSIRTFQLENVEFPSLGHCIRLLRAYPYLDHLALKFVTWNPQSPLFANPQGALKRPTRKAPIYHLDLWSNEENNIKLNRLIKWIISANLDENIRALSLQGGNRDFTSCTLRCARSTRNMFLMIDSDRSLRGFENCGYLQSLHLWCDDNQFPVQAITSALVSSPSKDLSKLFIYMQAPIDGADIADPGSKKNDVTTSYNQLDILLHDRASSGISINLCLCASGDEAEKAVAPFEEKLGELLPKFMQRASDKLRVGSTSARYPWKIWVKWCDTKF